MKYDNTEDEYGFWQPEPTRKRWRARADTSSSAPSTARARSSARSAGSSVRSAGSSASDSVTASGARVVAARTGTDEPTRQLRRLEIGRGRPGELQSPAEVPKASVSSRRDAMRAAELDELSALLDQDIAAAMGEDVAVVPLASRRSWRSRVRREDGRIEPFAARIGVLLLVGVVAIPLGAGLSSGSAAPAATSTARQAVAAVAPTASVAAADTTQPGAPANASESTAALDVAATDPAPPTASDASRADATHAAATHSPSTNHPPTSPDPVATPTAQATVATTEAATVATGAAPDAKLATQSMGACATSYTVAAGDYWLGLADRANVSLSALLGANRATASTPIYPGRTICLPRGATTPLPPASTAAPTVAPTTASPTTTARKAVTTTATPTTTPKTTAPKVAAAVTTTVPRSTAPKVTTTVAPTTVPPTTAAPTTAPARVYTRAQVAQIVRDVWPDDLEDKAIAIATRESNLNPGVRNFCCYGLFQIYWSVHQGWLGGIGITSSNQLFDPTWNATAALALYNRDGGWGPWGG